MRTSAPHSSSLSLIVSPQVVVPVLAGAAAGAMVAAIPTPVIEWALTSIGLSEIVPQAAPPLGLRARLILIGFAAAMVSVASALILHHIIGEGSGRTRSRVIRSEQQQDRESNSMRTALPGRFSLRRLIEIARGETPSAAAGDTGFVWRKADRHPDAPLRSPLIASRDLPPVPDAGSEPVAQASRLPTLPNAPEPLEMSALPMTPRMRPIRYDDEISAVDKPRLIVPPIAANAPLIPSATVDESQPPLPERESQSAPPSIGDLTARFEQGMAKRIALREAERARAKIAQHVPSAVMAAPATLADMPVEQKVPVKEQVDAEIDAALQTALGTLRRMVDAQR